LTDVQQEIARRIAQAKRGDGRCVSRAGPLEPSYGYLDVLGPAGTASSRDALCHVKCQLCGTEKRVRAKHLKSGATQSCGCLQRKIASENGKRRTGRRSGGRNEES
jgi:hypothetical protein